MSQEWFLLRNDKKSPHTLAELREMAASGQLLPTDMLQQSGTARWLAPAQAEGVVGWYYAVSGQQGGPVTWSALRQLAEQMTLKPTDIVWHAGLAEWVEAGKVESLIPKAPAVRMPPPLPKTATPPILPDPTQANKVTGEIHYLGRAGEGGWTVWVMLDGQKIGEGDLASGFRLRFETTVGQHTLKIAWMCFGTTSPLAAWRGEPPVWVEMKGTHTPFVLHSPGHYVITLNHPRKKFTAIFGNLDHVLPSELDIKKT